MSQARDNSEEDRSNERKLANNTMNPESATEETCDLPVSPLRASRSPATEKSRPGDAEATRGHQSDSLIGETVTLSGGDEDSLIGNFRLTKRLGRGGFGVVYAADDLRLDRRVAIKVPFAVQGEVAAEYYKRVIREARAAAALDHPNIVSIFDVAERDGQPFIVSQLIEGPSLFDRNTAGRIDQRAAAELLVPIARALAYAHKRGIIHRDLKPGNILLDEDGVPYVNDFGIAKYESIDETISTENSILGTPAYMSPEQAAGHSRDVDRRSDVYSLGVILYELITGERPFRGSSRMLLHQVIHDEPQRPQQLVQAIHRDIETICLKCLEKEPARRYQHCGELADELRRYLDGDAIKARPVSRIEHAWRRCRRYPLATALGLALLLSLSGGLAGVTWQWRRAEHNRLSEEAARHEAEQSREELAQQVDYSNRLLYAARIGLAETAVSAGDHQQARIHLNLSSPGLEKYRDVEYDILKNHVDRYEKLFQHHEQVTDVAISDDQTMIAACGLRTLLVWDVSSGQVIHHFREKQRLQCVSFAPNSNLLAWSGLSGQILCLIPNKPGQDYAVLDHGSAVHEIAFSHDGSQLLSAGNDGKISIWSMASMERIRVIEAHKGPVLAAQFIDREHVLSGGQDRRICTSNIATGESTILTVADKPVTAIAASGDGKRFAAGLESTRMLVGDLDNVQEARLIDLPGSYLVDLEFLDDPNLLVASNFFGKIYVWNLPDIRAARMFQCVKGFGQFAIARNSNRMIIGSGDGAIESIRLGDVLVDEITFDWNSLNEAKIIGDGQTIVACPKQGTAQIVHLATGRLLQSIPDSTEPASTALGNCTMLCVDESHDGRKLAFGTDDGRVLVLNVADGKLRVHGTAGGVGIAILRWMRDGSKLVAGGKNGAVRLWDLTRSDNSKELTRHAGVIQGLEIAPDGDRLITVAADGSASLLSTQTWVEETRLENSVALHSVAWSNDSQHIALGDANGGVLIYPRDLSAEPKRLPGHAGAVTCILFTPSGQTMLTGGNDHDIRFWDTQLGQTKLVVGNHDRVIQSISLSRSGDTLTTADIGGSVRIWPTQAVPLR